MARIQDSVVRIQESVVAARPHHRHLDLALRVAEHDKDTAGGVISGAVAFRLFLWLLPAALVITAILGFQDQASAEDEATSVGLGGFAADTIGQAAAQAHRSRWVALIIGVVLLISVSRTLARTVTIAIALTWREPVRTLRQPVRATLVTVAVMTAALAATFVTGWLRERAPGVGLAATFAIFVVWAGLWWGISVLLPHPELPWWGLLPGALFVGLGMEAMHLAVVLYFSHKITEASPLYGSLSAAATLLLAAYVLSRLVVASAALNATVHGRWAAEQGDRAIS